MRRALLALLLASVAVAAPTETPVDAAPDSPTSVEPVDAAPPRPLPDRSQPPPVEPPTPLDHPAPVVHTLRPGVRAFHLRVPGLRKARVDLLFRRGPLELAGERSAEVTAMAWMWDQATRRTSAEELARFEAVNDLDVWSGGSLQRTTVRLEAPLGRLDDGLGLLREVVTRPRFLRSDARTLSRNMLRDLLAERPSRADTVIDDALSGLWYPRDHPWRASPDAVGWRDLKKRGIRRRYAQLLRQAPLDVVVVADCDWSVLGPKVDALVTDLGVDGPPPAPPEVTPPDASHTVGVDFGATGQVAIALRLAAPRRSDPDAAAFRAIQHALGGSFLSRLNVELRETRGLTYGAGSDLLQRDEVGHWTVMLETSVDDVGEVLDVLDALLAEVAREGLTAQEIADARVARVAAWNQRLATVGTAAALATRHLDGDDGVARMRGEIRDDAAVTVEATRRVATTWLGPDAPRQLVLVGDRSRLAPLLEDRGLEVDWVPSELIVLGAW